MAFRRLICRDGLIPDVGEINRSIGVDTYRWIGSFDLGESTWNLELGPSNSGISAKHAALQAGALIYRQPHRSIAGDVKMAMETAAIVPTRHT